MSKVFQQEFADAPRSVGCHWPLLNSVDQRVLDRQSRTSAYCNKSPQL